MYLKPLLLGTMLTLISAICAAQEFRSEIDRMYAAEPGVSPQIRFRFPPRDGLVRIDVLVSQGKDGRHALRNRLDRIYFRNGKLEAVKRRADERSDFWSAAIGADRMLRVESKDNTLRFFHAAAGTEITPPPPLSAVAANALRTPGSYLLPQPENCPALPALPLQAVEEFRALPPEREEEWLRNRLETAPGSREELALLERLSAIGVFSYPMKAEERERWNELLLNGKLGVAPRRLLLSRLSEANFLLSPDATAKLLKDPQLGKEAARLCFERNRPGFEILIREWSRDAGLRETALRYSAYMAEDGIFRKQMLADFRKPTPEQSLLLIPLYAEEYRSNGSSELKQMLVTAKFPGEFRRLHLLAEWILRTNPKPYAAEIGQFLRRERNNRDLERSVIYPLLLASLCRAEDQEGIQKSIAYLEALDDPARIENAKRIWGGKMNGQITRERIINELKK